MSLLVEKQFSGFDRRGRPIVYVKFHHEETWRNWMKLAKKIQEVYN